MTGILEATVALIRERRAEFTRDSDFVLILQGLRDIQVGRVDAGGVIEALVEFIHQPVKGG